MSQWLRPAVTWIACVAALVLVAVIAGLLANRLPWRSKPGFGPRLLTYLTQNEFRSEPDSPFPERRPMALNGTPQQALDGLHSAMQELRWQQISRDGATIKAVVPSRWLGFLDDLTVRVEVDDETTWLYVTSSSRVGRGDLGANTRHVLDLRARLIERDMVAQ